MGQDIADCNFEQVIEEDNNDENVQEALSSEKEFEGLALACAILEQNESLYDIGRKAFNSCQRTRRLWKTVPMMQATIVDHFNTK